MKDKTTTSLKENFAIAQKRYQPYINLTNQIYSVEELSSEEIIKEIKKAEIKSLYFRSEKVSFDNEFASNIHKLVKAGIREV